MAKNQETIEIPLSLGRADRGRALTSGEFAEAEFDRRWKYERVEGRLRVMAPAGEGHSRTTEPWRDYLGAYRLARRDVVELVVSEAWVRPDGENDRVADISVYLVPTRPVPPRPDRIPDLVFEVVSPGKKSRERDYVEKQAIYHRLGVREYVIIDRRRKVVTVLAYTPEGYLERTLTGGDTYESQHLPGLAIPLSEIF